MNGNYENNRAPSRPEVYPVCGGGQANLKAALREHPTAPVRVYSLQSSALASRAGDEKS